uniref:JmjC domain-containing protein n=1 Tax=Calcidiscus leptoporus TaxID=127549 RepID=A0A7S0IL10_9EUKA|mmetsp:Transcript_11964/g.27718  ORF Transcript_11964/g.27718 Transcript_11964/m.27718 type:complete len:354 (+) Transcript_11964:50-1111(+)
MARWDAIEPVALRNSIPILRKNDLSPEVAWREHVIAGDEGLPVVVTDATEGWEARKKWSVSFFAQKFGDDEIIVNDKAPLRQQDHPQMQTYKMPLVEYVKYLGDRHHWLATHERGSPFYGNSWAPFVLHDEMRLHIQRMYFVQDLVSDDGQLQMMSRQFTKVFFGPPNTRTRLHYDTYSLHAWLSQIRGRKQFILYPKSQAHLLHAGEGIEASQSWFDPTAPDFTAFPRARQATPYVAVCEEGDTLFCPSGWFHYALSLTPSITLMRNFFNEANFAAFAAEWTAKHSPTLGPSMPNHKTGIQRVGSKPPRVVESDSHSCKTSTQEHLCVCTQYICSQRTCSRQQWRHTKRAVV